MALGELELVVLLALARLGGESHGAAIALSLDEHAHRRVSPGALYTVLDRLATKDCVEGWIGESTPERGGRRRKEYRLLPEGAREVRTWYAGVQELASGTEGVLAALAGEA